MADFNTKIVLKIALISRLLSLLVQSAFNNLIADYDSSEEHCSTESNVNGSVALNELKDSFADGVVFSLLRGNTKWDAVYFLDIAQNSYQYEQNMAFFPLFPLLVHSFGITLKPVQLFLNLRQKPLLILAATVINTSAFVFAALGLFYLTKTIFQSQKLAFKATVFFCFNPASVFFSAAYSESLFAMTQFWGMFFLEKDPISFLPAALLFSLGTGTRSNGAVSIGFIGYKLLKEILHTRYKKLEMPSFLVVALLMKTFQMALLVFIVILPFAAFQYYGFTLFCRSAAKSPWCNEFLPIPYRYIQKHYWNVGFLRYFEVKQLPNFLLAGPVVLLGVSGILEYLKNQAWRDIVFLGLLTPRRSSRGRYPANLFVYVVHLSFLLVFGVTSMHVQVVTRFVASSSPMIYWFAAIWATPRKLEKTEAKLRTNLKSKLVHVYFLLYYWLGFLLHCNFYPWT